MFHVRNPRAALRCALVVSLVVTATVASAATSTFLDLDRGEPFEAMVVHGNHLWVGQSRTRFNADYRVQVFDANGARVAEAKLPHAVAFLYAHGPNTVLAVGTAHTPNLTHYSILSLANGKVQARTTQIPINAWAYQWLGTFGGVEHFLDFSGNAQDPELGNNFELPAQTIFAMIGRRATYLPIRLRAPLNGKKVGDIAYVVRAYAMGHPATNLVRVDVAKRQSKDLFATPLDRARDFVALDGGRTLAISVQGNDALRFVNASDAATLTEVTVDGGPASLTTLGQCVLVGAEVKKEVVAVRRDAAGKATVAMRIDFSGTGERFRGLRKIVVNPSTGTVYGRSAYPCNPMAEDCTVLWNSIAATDAKTSAKLLDACR
jgi:hypothetical protein